MSTTHMKYDPPMNLEELRESVPRLLKCPIHYWRAKTGIELIHREPTIEEQKRIYKNWLLLSAAQKRISDVKSKELFGVSNMEHHKRIMKELRNRRPTES